MRVVLTKPVVKMSDEEKQVLYNFISVLNDFCDSSTCSTCPFGKMCETTKQDPPEIMANILKCINYEEVV
jgi:hypothetical protein